MIFNEKILTMPNGYTRDEMESELAFLEQDYANGEVEDVLYENARGILNMFLTDDMHWTKNKNVGQQEFCDPAYDVNISVLTDKEERDLEQAFLDYEQEWVADDTYENMKKLYDSDPAPEIKQDRENTQDVLEVASNQKQKQIDVQDVIDVMSYDKYGLEL